MYSAARGEAGPVLTGCQYYGAALHETVPCANRAQAWAYVFPVSLLRIPYSLVVAVFWSVIVYYPVGLSPDPATCATALPQPG